MLQIGGTASARGVSYSDLGVAVAVIAVVIMMVVPLPTFILDLLLTFNITFAPVSYTHLDVYKRQICDGRWLAPCSSSSAGKLLERNGVKYHE